MRSLLRFLLVVCTLGLASLFGCSGTKTGSTGPPPPTDVTLHVPGMN